MSINLLEAVQQNLGYPALQKIDPNTQQVVVSEKTPDEDRFSQAAVPAVLTALHKYVQSDEGASEFLRNDNDAEWIDNLFGDKRKEAIQVISSYSRQSNEDPVTKMNVIAREAVKVTKENLPDNAGIKEVKDFFSHQINTFLVYLPAGLNIGELLNDTTLDDKTNKMQGPLSSLIQSVGSAFSAPVTGEKIK